MFYMYPPVKLLKLAKEAIGKKDYERVNDICQALLEVEPENYNGRVFLGVALQNLGKPTAEVADAYKRAIAADPAQLLAWQGLVALYDKAPEYAAQHIEEHETALTGLFNLLQPKATQSADVASKVAECLVKLTLCRDAMMQKQQTPMAREALLAMYRSFYDDDGQYVQYRDLASTLPVAKDTPLSSKATLLRTIVNLTVAGEEEFIARETRARKFRLGNANPKAIADQVALDAVMTTTVERGMTSLISELSSVPNSKDEIVKLSVQLYDRLVLKSTALHQRGQHIDDTWISEQLARLSAELVASGAHLGALEKAIDDIDARSATDYPRDLLERLSQLAREQSADSHLARAATAYLEQPHSLDKLSLAERSAHYTKITNAVSLSSAANSSSLVHIFAYHIVVSAAAGAHQWLDVIGYATSALRRLDEISALSSHSFPLSRAAFEVAKADAYTAVDAKRYHDEISALYDSVLRVLPNDSRALLGCGRTAFAQGKFELTKTHVLQLLDSVSDSVEGWTLLGSAEQGLKRWSDAEAATRKAIEIYGERQQFDCPVSASNLQLQLGGIIIGSGEASRRPAGLECLLRSAKLDPSNSAAFRALGEYYSSSSAAAGSTDRALKCFRKAFSLDPADAVSGMVVVSDYLRSGDEAAAEEALRKSLDISASSSNASHNKDSFWAHRLLGLLQLRHHRYGDAILTLRGALRIDDSCAELWEALGECYLHSGRFNSALRTLLKAHSINEERSDTRPGPLLLLAQVHTIIGDFSSALSTYDLVEPTIDTPQLSMLRIPFVLQRSQCLIRSAHQLLGEGFFGRAAAQCARALCDLHGIASETDSEQMMMPIVWKCVLAASDILLRTRCFNVDGANAALGLWTPFCALDTASGSVALQWSSLCCAAASALTKLSGNADDADLRSSLARAWHQSAVAHAYRARLSPESSAEDLKTALSNIHAALRLEPASPQLWSTLGHLAVAASALPLAQHAFIRSLQLNSRNSTQVLISLGFLYLLADGSDHELALEAFERAHATNPEHPLALIGIALSQPPSAPLSKRSNHLVHAFELSQGCYALGNISLASALLEDDAVVDVDDSSSLLSLATIALRKHTERNPLDIRALEMLGMLLERQGEHSGAADVYIAASSVVGAARALCASEQYEAALALYQQPDMAQSPSLYTLIGHGLASFFAGDLEGSLQLFEQALSATDAAESAAQRTDVAIMLAKVLWALGSAEHRAMAKDQLLGAIGSSKDLSPGTRGQLLTSLLAMSLFLGDMQLAQAVQDETRSASTHLDQDTRDAIAVLSAHITSVSVGAAAARRILASTAYKSPSNSSIWRHLTDLLLLLGEPGQSNSAVVCASNAVQSLGVGASSVDSAHALASLSRAVDARGTEISDWQTAPVTSTRAKRLAQRAVMDAPWDLEHWAAVLKPAMSELALTSQDHQQLANAGDGIEAITELVQGIHPIVAHLARVQTSLFANNDVQTSYALAEQLTTLEDGAYLDEAYLHMAAALIHQAASGQGDSETEQSMYSLLGAVLNSVTAAGDEAAQARTTQRVLQLLTHYFASVGKSGALAATVRQLADMSVLSAQLQSYEFALGVNGDPKAALDALSSALANPAIMADPQLHSLCKFLQTLAYWKMGNHTRAIKAITALLGDDSSAPPAFAEYIYFYLGWIHLSNAAAGGGGGKKAVNVADSQAAADAAFNQALKLASKNTAVPDLVQFLEQHIEQLKATS
ncbi:TPR-like protein [Ramicandelaber brevisporus]|nr:TPR-like protein [Ramicandelaber brevisporus]